jgi:hypothetical protein
MKENKDEISNYQKDYYQRNSIKYLIRYQENYKNNRLAIIQKQKDRYKDKVGKKKYCHVCCTDVSILNFKQHCKSNKHITYFLLFNSRVDFYLQKMNELVLKSKKLKFVFNK